MILLEGLLRRMSCSMSVDRVAAGSRASSTWMTTSAACTTFITSLYAAFRIGSAHGSISVIHQANLLSAVRSGPDIKYCCSSWTCMMLQTCKMFTRDDKPPLEAPCTPFSVSTWCKCTPSCKMREAGLDTLVAHLLCHKPCHSRQVKICSSIMIGRAESSLADSPAYPLSGMKSICCCCCSMTPFATPN